jgi:aminoglycoside phosphotransferase (APT) family kinase protein
MTRGRASSVTDLGDGTVLRVGGRPEREAPIMELARAHGFPVPRVHEIRPDAMVLERIEGPTMGQAMTRRPWEVFRHVRSLADLHERLHAIPFDGGSVIHFDLHPDNVLLSSRGPVVIDWTNARGGSAATDVAMTWLILETSAGLPGRLLAWLFRRRVGHDVIRRGLADASAFRLADPNVRVDEKKRVRGLRPNP